MFQRQESSVGGRWRQVGMTREARGKDAVVKGGLDEHKRKYGINGPHFRYKSPDLYKELYLRPN